MFWEYVCMFTYTHTNIYLRVYVNIHTDILKIKRNCVYLNSRNKDRKGLLKQHIKIS